MSVRRLHMFRIDRLRLLKLRLSDCLIVWIAAAVSCGCVDSHAGGSREARPEISAAQVRIYLQPPAAKYVHVADVSATSRGSFTFSAAAKMDAVIERLKEQAAHLGANGLLLHGVEDQAAGSLGAGVSTETNDPRAAPGLGFGASTWFSRKVGDGEAIFVEPDPAHAATAPAN